MAPPEDTLFPKNVCEPVELPAGFLAFLEPLHRRYTPDQQCHAMNRASALSGALDGSRLPGGTTAMGMLIRHFMPADWRIALPEWITDQRNQMTGPADDAELCVKMLNSGAPGVMLDLEDSMANTWEHTRTGVANAVKALHGELTYTGKKGEAVGIKPSKTVTFTRVRGLHMSQHGVFKDGPVSASLFDAALLVYLLDPAKLKHPLCLYIPKTEHAAEAIWWNQVLKELAKAKGMPEDWIKCMALVEAHPFAYQMEEFIYLLKDHLIGLNLGRWDYMASLIHFTLADQNWVLPDRNTIPHDVPFFQNLRALLVETCHKRGIFAIGGMTALYPSRADAALNERALAVLEKDKNNEAACGFDGAWTGHPDQNAIAVGAFPEPNQLGYRVAGLQGRPDLRPLPTGIGKITLEGTRAAVRTTIRYRHGVLSGRGASLLDGYMEDLATDRIYRLMVAQRVRHAVDADDGAGSTVMHTRELAARLYKEEAARLISALQYGPDSVEARRYEEAAAISLGMIERGEFDPT
jgi:malate synthase